VKGDGGGFACSRLDTAGAETRKETRWGIVKGDHVTQRETKGGRESSTAFPLEIMSYRGEKGRFYRKHISVKRKSFF